MHTIIVGSGLAGITLARELRKLDKTRRLTLVTADAGAFYAKPSLSNAFAGGKTAATLLMSSAEKLAQELQLEILTHCPVTRIEAAGNYLHTTRGALHYDQLVLAVGASQRPVQLAGPCEEILSVNSLDDYARLRERLAGKQRIAIIGAGLIGCEFANDLRLGDFEVDLYDQASRPLERQLPMEAALRMQAKLSEIGVGFHLESRLQAVERDNERLRLIDDRGHAKTYDVIISAIGLLPNLALANSAQLATGLGLRVDAYLRTSDPHIYALGDCVELDGHYLPYVMPILHCAKKLAMTLNGQPEPIDLPAMPIVVKTPACPTVFSPPKENRGEWRIESDHEGLRALYEDPHKGELLGFVLQGSHTRERMALTARLPKPALFIRPARSCQSSPV